MRENVRKIKAVVFDVDGTLTDGVISIDNSGNERKSFNVKDGFAIAKASEYGVICAIITGRDSEVVNRRAKELKIKDVYQGIKDKRTALKEISDKYGILYEEIAYFGDDINDLPAFLTVGFTGTTVDGADEIKEIADIVTKTPGGKGAAREFLEFILKELGIWQQIIDSYKK